MSWKIEPREGVEIYLSEHGSICLKQEDLGHPDGFCIVRLDPSMIPKVIEYLQLALDQHLDGFRQSANAEDDESGE